MVYEDNNKKYTDWTFILLFFKKYIGVNLLPTYSILTLITSRNSGYCAVQTLFDMPVFFPRKGYNFNIMIEYNLRIINRYCSSADKYDVLIEISIRTLYIK